MERVQVVIFFFLKGNRLVSFCCYGFQRNFLYWDLQDNRNYYFSLESSSYNESDLVCDFKKNGLEILKFNFGGRQGDFDTD